MISLAEALAIHTELITATGGSQGVRDRGGLEAALARPFASFGGADLYPKPIDKDETDKPKRFRFRRLNLPFR